MSRTRYALFDPEQQTDNILELRSNALKMRTEGGFGITNIKQLSAAGLDEGLLDRLSGVTPLNVHSQYFEIITQGDYTGVHANQEALVEVDLESYPINPDNEDSFGKRDAKASGMVVNQENIKFDPAVRVIQIRD